MDPRAIERYKALRWLESYYPHVPDLTSTPAGMEAIKRRALRVIDEYEEELCFSESFSSALIEVLTFEGFLCMSIECEGQGAVMTPKMHKTRCVAKLESVRPSTRSFKKKYSKMKELVFVGDDDLNQIASKCREYHSRCWMTKELTDAYSKVAGVCRPVCCVAWGVRRGDGELVAGEIGVLISDSVYLALTGFANVSKIPNVGNAQMLCTAQALRSRGFTLLDLGMPMKYKRETLKAEDFSRKKFIELFRKVRSLNSTRASDFACEEIVADFLNSAVAQI